MTLPLGPTGLKFVLAHCEDQSTKRSRFPEEQIIGILKEHEDGVAVAELSRKHGVSDASITSGRPVSAAWMSPRRDACGRSRTRTPG